MYEVLQGFADERAYVVAREQWNGLAATLVPEP